MTLIEFVLIALVVFVTLLVWWFDLFCLKRSDEQWEMKEACKRFCSKRQEDCKVSPEDVEMRCSDRQQHEEAKNKFRSVRSLLKDKIGKADS